MANSFVNHLRREIGSVEKELSGDPRFKKWKRLMAALDAYLEQDEEAEDALEGEDLTVLRGKPKREPGRSPSDRTQQILDFAEKIIDRNGPIPIRTIEILEQLRALGHEVHGANPRNTLSAILSYSGRFKPHGRSGWTMKGEDDADDEVEAADEPSFAGRSPTASDHRLTNGGTHRGPVNPRPGGGT